MKILLVVSQLTPYMWHSARALNRLPEHHVRVIAIEPPTHHNFNRGAFIDDSLSAEWAEPGFARRGCRELFASWRPDRVLVGGWFRPGLRSVISCARSARVPCLCLSDTPYIPGTSGSGPRLWYKRFYLRRHCAAIMVPGDRAALQAERLGFQRSRQLRPLYCTDTRAYRPIEDSERERCFLFAGRWAPEKNINTLVDAYALYRGLAPDPWSLHIAGPGQRAISSKVPGVEYLGMIQPADLQAKLQRSGVFVLPSTFDPWPVVLLEAAAAGLPLLASWACGNSVELVVEGLNGFRFDPHNPAGLAQLMAEMTSQPLRLASMGAYSAAIASQYDSSVWATTVSNWAKTS